MSSFRLLLGWLVFKLFKSKKTSKEEFTHSLMGERAYIIGDIHGCFDELQKLLSKIEADMASRDKSKKTTIVFLGDLIDRGPKSREVIEFLVNFKPDYADTVYLMGNHEEVFLNVLDGDSERIASWFTFGGRDCMRSYKVADISDYVFDPDSLCDRFRAAVPKQHVGFLSSFKHYHILGDYLCVHAGIRPGIDLQDQRERDMRWIRSSFLDYKKIHPYMVVHGHSVVDQPEKHNNRIAIDTGVYDSGVLTALYIEEDVCEFIQSSNDLQNDRL